MIAQIFLNKVCIELQCCASRVGDRICTQVYWFLFYLCAPAGTGQVECAYYACYGPFCYTSSVRIGFSQGNPISYETCLKPSQQPYELCYGYDNETYSPESDACLILINSEACNSCAIGEYQIYEGENDCKDFDWYVYVVSLEARKRSTRVHPQHLTQNFLPLFHSSTYVQC